MKKLNVDKLKSYWNRLNKMDRSVPINSISRECQKEVFVKRTLNKYYAGKYFKWIERKETGYYINNKPHFTNIIHYSIISYIEYQLGYNEKIRIMYRDAHETILLKELVVGLNELLDIEFQEIDSKKYSKVLKLFYISPILKTYTFLCYDKGDLEKGGFNVSIDNYTKEKANDELSKTYIVMGLIKESKTKLK